ncbi:MAG: Ig-like domain-containing protein [Candidatus Azobacteroides sp.]|nr:Ig-like domain-containing protein [Candidatus Azobacteroides sp.]
MKKIFLLTLLVSFTLTGFTQRPDFSMVGFATMNGGTTGGAGATEIIDVYNADELEAAIGTRKEGGQDPRIIRINGVIKKSSSQIEIKECSNITIFGADENAGFEQTPLIINMSSNIIIRNLYFTMVGRTGGKDLIEITTNGSGSTKSQNIWIDHCEFYNETPTAAGAETSLKDRYDGLLDIKRYSEYITVSWCYFHDHYKAILIGYTASDTLDRKITMHHNRFVRINSRIPSLRGGTAHIYNNYFEGWIENGVSYGNCIHTREGCNALVENNYFTKLNRAVYWEPKDATEGFAYGTGNYFTPDVTSGFTSQPAASPFVPPYGEVDQNIAEELPLLLEEYAGTGKITSYDDYGEPAGDNKAPSIIITSPETGDTYDSPATITLSADVTDEDGYISKVELFKDNELITTLDATPYSYTFTDLMVGAYTFTIRAFDDKSKFSSKSVSVIVKAPTLEIGESIFGDSAPENNFFWFGENTDNVSALLSNNTITGSATLSKDKEDDVNGHNGALVVPQNGDIIFTLPSCTVFKLYMTRTGDFAGSVYASTDGVNWGNPVAGISGRKGAQEVDYSEYVTSASPIYVRIVNTSSGGLNIHGANIRLAQKTETGIPGATEENKTISTINYFSISGLKVKDLKENTIYIKETIYDDGSIERIKIFNY